MLGSIDQSIADESRASQAIGRTVGKKGKQRQRIVVNECGVANTRSKSFTGAGCFWQREAS